MRKIADSRVDSGVDEGMADLAFDEERLLPTQWVTPEEPPDVGERRLMRAVLEQALYDLKKPGTEHCTEALLWFFGPPTAWLYDFETICGGLGFDPDALRNEIRKRGRFIAKNIRPRWATAKNREKLPPAPLPEDE